MPDHVAFLIYPDCLSLDVAGPHEVFAGANRWLTAQEHLAERAHMSPRHFARCFRREVGITPARYVLGLRLEAARRMLEETHKPLEHVAEQCGFGSTETMRRWFLRALKVTPWDYRQRFHPHTPTRPGPSAGAWPS